MLGFKCLDNQLGTLGNLGCCQRWQSGSHLAWTPRPWRPQKSAVEVLEGQMWIFGMNRARPWAPANMWKYYWISRLLEIMLSCGWHMKQRQNSLSKAIWAGAKNLVAKNHQKNDKLLGKHQIMIGFALEFFPRQILPSGIRILKPRSPILMKQMQTLSKFIQKLNGH